MACWRRGLTHIPFKDTFMGSNPVQVTNKKITALEKCRFFVFLGRTKVSIEYVFIFETHFLSDNI